MGMNTVIGSGLEVTYLPMPKLELKGGLRGNFFQVFDLQRSLALKGASITTQDSKREQGELVLTNAFSRFYNVEIGGFYRLMEKEKDGSSKVVVSDQAEPGQTNFAEAIEVNTKVLQVVGARLGLSSMQSTVSVKTAIDKQNLNIKGSQGNILTSQGTTSPSGFKTPFNTNELFSTFSSTGFYIGAGLQRIKNINIKTDKQGIVSHNSILSFYADLILNPWTQLSEIKARRVGGSQEETFNLSPIKFNKIGGRAGFEIRYNQASFLSFGAELGYRPAIKGQGLYGLLKVSVPTFSFGSKHKKVANNIGNNQSLSK
jgi:hypothetical protein